MKTFGAKPERGVIRFPVILAPVSMQSANSAKLAFIEHVRVATRTAGFLLSGDVKVTVEWRVSERARYETDRSPDVDNILKPLIDAMTGPEGLLVDDNQIQHVSCAWIDGAVDEESLTVEISFSEDEWLPKHGLKFVQLSMGLCFPVPGTIEVAEQLSFIEMYKRVIELRSEAAREDIPYTWARLLMPKQRVFHRTRLHAFPVYSYEEFPGR